ncbi:MAG TPA: AraC family transcriptional regulator, partial [Bacillota bacterium]|nr:AraC family transcriptional regulator [Bacillota bacterium]
QEILEYIDKNLSSKITIQDIASAVHLSPSHLSSLFKQKTGLTVYSFILSKRLILARKLLMETDMLLDDIAEECGFSDVSSFIRCFRERVGTTPGQYRRSSR